MIGKPRRNVLVSAECGTMLVNRFDYNPENNFGVGQFILDKGIDCMVPAYILKRYFTDKYRIINLVLIIIKSEMKLFLT